MDKTYQSSFYQSLVKLLKTSFNDALDSLKTFFYYKEVLSWMVDALVCGLNNPQPQLVTSAV